jgi:hypothetical protein
VRIEEQVDVHARAECYVNGVVEVGGEEDYSLEVFQLAEEDYWVLAVFLLSMTLWEKWEGNSLVTSSFRELCWGER